MKFDVKQKKCELKSERGYYLGRNEKDGLDYYLGLPSWDCGWYWGFGYVAGYGRLGGEFFHFDCWGDEVRGDNLYNQFISKISSTPLSESKLWALCDYMVSFYGLKTSAELFGRGKAHYSSVPFNYKDEAVAKQINTVTLPALFEAIDKIFIGD